MMNRGAYRYLPITTTVVFIILSQVALAHLIPDATGFVSDFAGVLTSDEKDQLEGLSKEVREANGTELVIVTVEKVGGDFDTIRVDYFNEQGIGQKGKDNGILILLATRDKKIGITTGRGMEAVLPDSLCKEIIDTKGIPCFEDRDNGQFGKGLIAIAEELASYIKGEESARSGTSIKQGCFSPAVLGLFAAIFISLIIGLPATTSQEGE